MSEQLWTSVDGYLSGLLLEHDEALRAALAASAAAGLPEIQVTPLAGKFLHLMARAMGARRILEIGTLGGYSTIWLGRAVAGNGGGPGHAGAAARVISLEADPRHAGIARGNIARAGLDGVVEVRLGKALDTLPLLLAEMPARGPFDLFFIDADKGNNAAYFQWALRLARPGSLIVVDNVVRKGEVANPVSTDEDVQGTRRLFDAIAAAQREGLVSATALQTVSEKNYDGLAIAVVN